jgi:methyltransferase (TIGR00027 family)
MPAGPISHVSDTARWVALYRAIESERPDALFHDPFARRLAGTRGAEILDAMPKGRAWAWPMIVRTAVMDEVIMRLARARMIDGVLNLAAGLDTRPYRLAVPETLRWTEVDFPDILDYKAQALAGERTACVLERAGADLTDSTARAAVFARVASSARAVLVISEGLLIYLSDSRVRDLATALHAHAELGRWLFDLASPALLRLMDRTWGRAVAAGNAPFRFAPAAGTRFFEDTGWRETEYHSIWEASLRLGRTMRFAWLWQALGRLAPRARREQWRRMSGVVLMTRA